MSKNNGNTKAKTWLITGASSGLGHALAEYALQQGDRVALGARSRGDYLAVVAGRWWSQAEPRDAVVRVRAGVARRRGAVTLDLRTE